MGEKYKKWYTKYIDLEYRVAITIVISMTVIASFCLFVL